MLFAFTSRGFYIIDCQDSPNIIFDFAHHRFLHEAGLEWHFSTASQLSYDNACVCSNNKPLDWFSSLFFVCAFFHFVTNHSNNEIGIMFALGNNIRKGLKNTVSVWQNFRNWQKRPRRFTKSTRWRWLTVRFSSGIWNPFTLHKNKPRKIPRL